MKNNGVLDILEKTKHKNILYQNYCKPAYVPKKISVCRVRKGFGKYFVRSVEKDWTLPKSKGRAEEGKGLDDSFKELGFKNAFVVRVKSPCLRIRKGIIRGVGSQTNSSLLVRRARIYACSSPRIRENKSKVMQVDEHSNYMSYSDIYQSLVKNLYVN